MFSCHDIGVRAVSLRTWFGNHNMVGYGNTDTIMSSLDAIDVFDTVCDSNPCANGATCTGDDLQYTCDCAAGYTGASCETGEFNHSVLLCTLKTCAKLTRFL